MKILNKISCLSLLAGSMMFTSCSDSFLDRESLTEQPAESFWSNPKDAMLALASCYDGLQNKYLYNGDPYTFGPLYMDCITDNGGHFNWSGYLPGYDIAMGIQDPSSNVLAPYWKACYEVIKRCNFLIQNIDRIPDMKEDAKKQYIAEAKTIRGLMYTHLTMTFQDVPYVTEVLSMETAEQPKTAKNEIVKNVMADLKASAEVLPVKAERGRITKGACLSILGRLALYNNMWDEAINNYREVLKLGYTLHPDFGSLFTEEGETSSEIIFAVRYEGPGLNEGASYNGHWNTPLVAMNGTINLADDFYMLDGTRTTDTNYGTMKDGKLLPDQPNPNHFKNRDPRLYETLFVPGMLWNGVGNKPKKWYGGAAASMSTVYVRKFFQPENRGNSMDNGQDFYVVRYAEVLLSLAEALVQSGSYDEAEVVNYVNMVRQRSVNQMPKVEDVEGMGLTSDQLLEIIKHERRVELAFEGLRLFDLYRWKELDKAVERVEHERTTLKLAYEPRQFNGERDYVWPIPTAEIDTNSKLEQHPLWK